MTDELKRSFQLRITQANRTQLTVILYEMLLAYADDVENVLKSEPFVSDDFKRSLNNVAGCIRELKASLNLDIELSGTLLSIYEYIRGELEKCELKRNAEYLDNIRKTIVPLKNAFETISSRDESGSLMENTQQVVAGYTYGPSSVNETVTDQGANRGFFV